MNWSQRLHLTLPRVDLSTGAGAEVLEWNYIPHLSDNAPHRHTYCEICLIGDYGSGEFHVGAQTHAIASGDIFFARPGVIHQIINHSSPLMELYWVGFSVETKENDEISMINNAFLNSDIVVTQDIRVNYLWQALREICERSESTWESQARSLSAVLLTSLLEIGAGSKTLTPRIEADERRNHQTMLARAGVRYIEDNLHRKLQLAEIANHLHVSPRHLTRLFLSLTGVAPASYIERARLDRAENLLIKTDKPIQEIARQVGFEEAAHFSRVFAKRYGMPPVAFRRAGKSSTQFADAGRNRQERGLFI